MITHQQSFNLESISNPGLTIEKLKELLAKDQALKEIYAENLFEISDPDSPASVLEMCFSNLCGTFSTRLCKHLRLQGINCVEATSADPESKYHVYLLLFAERELLIVDPSIGQYLKGYRGIFIGSRGELKNLILSDETTFNFSLKDRNLFYQQTWGDESMTAYSSTRNLKIC